MSDLGELDRLRAVRLLVVGDIALFRDGIGGGLRRDGRFEVVGMVDVRDAAALVAAGDIPVIVLDASRRNAAQQARALMASRPGLAIVAFGVGDVDNAMALAEAGVRAFVDEQGSIETIGEAIAGVARGASILPPALTSGLLDRCSSLARAQEKAGLERLTSRESEIAGMVAEGLSNKEIARELSISPATVKNHVHAILGKSNLHRRAALGRQRIAGMAM